MFDRSFRTGTATAGKPLAEAGREPVVAQILTHLPSGAVVHYQAPDGGVLTAWRAPAAGGGAHQQDRLW
ncbi:hypothetical protein C0036_27200 [Streptomyces sp. DJ]|nr:hypothetical protein C0036_27200 [Streptomyces sp. DJ]